MMFVNLVLGLAFGSVAYSYALAPSCTSSKTVEDMIDDALTEAFFQAQAAVTALNRRPWNRNLPVDRAISDLAGWMFQDVGWDVPHPAPVLPAPDTRGHLDVVKDILTGVLTMQTKQAQALWPGDVLIHCDLARFKVKTDLRIYNEDQAHWDQLEDERKADLASCKDAGAGNAGAAWTENNGARGIYSEIQLCPPYLAEFGPLKYKTSRKILAAIVKPFGAKNVAMDDYSVLDNTLLHELTHTWAGGSTLDVRGPIDSYYWKNVVDFGDGSEAVKNAESINFFALGVRMITEQNLVPQHDGSVKPL